MNQITFQPLLPDALFLVLGLVICALTFWSYKKKLRGRLLRMGAAFLILFALSNPQITRDNTRTIKDIALIVVDQSSSQVLGDRQKHVRAALEYLKEESQRYQDLDVRFVHVRPDGQEDRHGSRVMGALKKALSGIDEKRYAGTVLITDGQIHDMELAKDLPGPIHFLLSGKKEDVDRRIEVVDAPKYGLVDEILTVRLKVLDNGVENQSAPITAILPDGTELSVPPADDKGIREVNYTPEYAGEGILVFETDALEDEASLTNNRTALTINAVRDRLRVLLVSGMPHQGQRTWRNILRSDAAVDLVHFTILRPSEKEDYTPLRELSLIAFPVHELFHEKLDEFDLIIFDRYFKRNVLNQEYFDNIERYIRNGGAVLVSAGPDFSGPKSLAATSLGDLLPARPSGMILDQEPYRLQRTLEGHRHPITAALGPDEEDWGRWVRLVDTVDARGNIILETPDNQPVLIVDRIDEGRIALLLSDHVWLWARGFDGGGPHAHLVRHLAHWLMKEPDLEEEKVSLEPLSGGRLKIIRHSLLDEVAPATLTRPGGQTQEVTLTREENGQFSATLNAFEAGLYRVKNGIYVTAAVIGSLNPKEFMDPRATDQLVKDLPDEIGGSIHWLEEDVPLLKRVSLQSRTQGSGWIGLKQNKTQAIIGVKHHSVLSIWVIFLSAVALWGLAWWRESR